MKQKQEQKQKSFELLSIYNKSFYYSVKPLSIFSNKLKKRDASNHPKQFPTIDPKPWFLPLGDDSQKIQLVSINQLKLPQKVNLPTRTIRYKTEPTETFSVNKCKMQERSLRSSFMRKTMLQKSWQKSNIQRTNFQLETVVHDGIGPWDSQNLDF